MPWTLDDVYQALGLLGVAHQQLANKNRELLEELLHDAGGDDVRQRWGEFMNTLADGRRLTSWAPQDGVDCWTYKDHVRIARWLTQQ